MTNSLFQFGDNARIRIQIRTYPHWDKWHHSDPNLQWSQQAATSTPFLREQWMREIFALIHSINQSIHQSINRSFNRSLIQSFIQSIHQSIHQSFHPSIIQSIKQWKSGKKGMKKLKVFYSGLMTTPGSESGFVPIRIELNDIILIQICTERLTGRYLHSIPDRRVTARNIPTLIKHSTH